MDTGVHLSLMDFLLGQEASGSGLAREGLKKGQGEVRDFAVCVCVCVSFVCCSRQAGLGLVVCNGDRGLASGINFERAHLPVALSLTERLNHLCGNIG